MSDYAGCEGCGVEFAAAKEAYGQKNDPLIWNFDWRFANGDEEHFLYCKLCYVRRAAILPKGRDITHDKRERT